MLAKVEWISPLVDVEIWETIGLLSTMRWVRDLQLVNVNFETDSKKVVDSIE